MKDRPRMFLRRVGDGFEYVATSPTASGDSGAWPAWAQPWIIGVVVLVLLFGSGR